MNENNCDYNYDLIIIGAGPGGYEAAFCVQKYGLKTAIVEKDSLGGTCLNRGCIPTKALLHSAELYHSILHGEKSGITAPGLKADRDQINAHKNEIVDSLKNGIESLIVKKKIDLYKGTAFINKPHVITVISNNPENNNFGNSSIDDNDNITITAKYILIATGSVSAVPPIPGVDLPGVIDSTELIKNGAAEIPELVIIGGGVIGVEFATVYADLGDHVIIIEGLDRLLPSLDKEIGRSIKNTLAEKNVECYLKSKVNKIEKSGEKLSVTFEVKDSEKTVTADKVLISVGRKPETAELFSDEILENYNLTNEKGFIITDEQYETACEGIYAIGDCIGGVQLAHAATAEGKNAVAFIAEKEGLADYISQKIDMNVLPACVYSSPEIATVGMNADEAKKEGIKTIVNKYPMSANGKTMIEGLGRGFIKIIARESDHVVIGAVLYCGRASDIISELAIAITKEMTIEEIAKIIHPHPTFTEAVMECAGI